MQAKPYVIVEGTVVGSRTVEVPEQESRTYTDREGNEKRTQPRKASSFLEVGVSGPGLLNGKVHDGVSGVLTVRWPEDQPVPADGTQVRWAVNPGQVKLFLRGRFQEWIVYYFAGEAPAAAVAPSATRHLAATGS